ncbi:MAG: DUF3866 family protein [Coriobacteriia bacterium]|nr:DUF3866 family protein [Coriobacteriia bacterium]
MRVLWAQIAEIEEEDKDIQRLRCQVIDPIADNLGFIQALHYLVFGPPLQAGQLVLLNMTAIDLGLGTGGLAFVQPNLSFSDYGQMDRHAPERKDGHIMKLRYSPLQREVMAVEEPSSLYHELLRTADSLQGLPVVCCSLHSQAVLVAAAIKSCKPEARVVYCMTDEAALLVGLSDVLRAARTLGLIDACISCGQAIGGDLEAVNIYSGLLAAKLACRADYAVCSIGPGVVGTGTAFGHGGLAQAQALNAVAALGGLPVATLRLSEADSRPRHLGLSHHSRTVLGRACLAKALVALPNDISAAFLNELREALKDSGISARHQVVELASQIDEIDMRGLRVTSMGRSERDDPVFFKAALAAGVLAANSMMSAHLA